MKITKNDLYEVCQRESFMGKVADLSLLALTIYRNTGNEIVYKQDGVTIKCMPNKRYSDYTLYIWQKRRFRRKDRWLTNPVFNLVPEYIAFDTGFIIHYPELKKALEERCARQMSIKDRMAWILDYMKGDPSE